MPCLLSAGPVEPAADRQTHSLYGLVTDLQGEPLPYAVISIPGTAYGTTSGPDGNYRLSGLNPGTYSVEGSFLGYKTFVKQMTLGGSDVKLDIVMEEVSHQIDEVVVYGNLTRGQAKALNTQKNDLRIVNVVDYEQFAKFPDRNTADALQRIPGVSISKDQGEGEYVMIRGLSPEFNSVQLNGQRIPSPDKDDARGTGMGLLLADMMQSIVVYKTMSADMDGDAIGGTVDFNLKEAFDAGDYLLRDVDPSKEIVLTRQGYLEGCPDLITFPERTLAKGNVTMMGDFRNQLMERYGEITPELLEREELDLDYDLASLEDILYFPNLKTLNLGKNRYFGSTKKVASLTDANKRARMYFCANVLNELNEGMDVNVYRAGNKAGDMVFYNFKQKLGVYEYEGTVNEMNGSQWPADLALLDTEGWTVDITPAGETPEEFRTEMLFDDNPVTQWVPNTGQTQRSYNLTIDMQEARTVRGLKIVQGQVTYSLQNFLLESVIVQVSADGQTWTYPCHMEENTMGAVSGEKRLLNFAEEQTVRYIRLTVKDRYSNNNTDCVLGDVIPF